MIGLMWCCFGRRKARSDSHDSINASRLRSKSAQSIECPKISNAVPKTPITELREKSDESPASTPEDWARMNTPLTPREIQELHQILSPAAKPGTSSSLATVTDGSQRTLTNKMLPERQVQSDLFRMPPEIRAEIWRHAMGKQKIYLAVRDGKLVQQSNMQQPYWRQVRRLLSVPLLCRQSYLESINFLYSENTFGFGFGPVGSSKDFFTQADTLLLPQCVAVMTSLEVGFHLSGGYSQYYDSHPQAWDLSLQIAAPEPLSSWNAVFKALAQMKHLRSLVVVVWASGDRRYEFVTREPELMVIPTQMTGLKKFEVWLPWEEDEEAISQDGDKTSRPYSVRRNFRDRERFGVSVPDWRG